MDSLVFVQNIKKFCDLKGVKPTVACRESGVGTSFINNVERGQTPSVAKVQMLADYLGVTTSELLGEKNRAHRPGRWAHRRRTRAYEAVPAADTGATGHGTSDGSGSR